MAMENTNWRTDFAERWVKYWTPPARPTPGSLAFIQEKLAAYPKKGPRVLVLGSTSEFRDMLFDRGIRPAVVDFSRDNYRILSQAMRHKDEYEDNERYVEADWCAMDLGEEFDIILGDAVFNIVPKESNGRLLGNIKRHLAPEGIYIERVHVFPEKYRGFDIAAETKKRREDIARHSFYYVFGTPSYLAAMEKDNEPIPLKKVSSLVDGIYAEGLITPGQYEEWRRLGKHLTDFVFFLPTEQFARDRLAEYFAIAEVHVDYDFPFYPEFYPNFVLKKF